MILQHCFPHTGRKKLLVLLLQKNTTYMTEIPKFHTKHCLNSHNVVVASILRKPQSCALHTMKEGCKWQWLLRTQPFLLEPLTLSPETKSQQEILEGAANNYTLEMKFVWFFLNFKKNQTRKTIPPLVSFTQSHLFYLRICLDAGNRIYLFLN